MTHPDIVRLALGEIEGPIVICSVADDVAWALGACTRRVLFSRANLEKQFKHHPEFRVHHCMDYPWMIANGEPYLNRTKRVAYFISPYQTEFRHSYKITVKATKSGRELWLTSAHPVASLSNLRRRSIPLWDWTAKRRRPPA